MQVTLSLGNSLTLASSGARKIILTINNDITTVMIPQWCSLLCDPLGANHSEVVI